MKDIAYYTEWLAGLVAFLLLFHKQGKTYRYLILYILFVVIADYCSKFAVIIVDGIKTNHYYYNIIFIVQLILFVLIFKDWKKATMIKPGSLVGLIIFWLCFSTINLFFVQGFYILNSWTYMLGYGITIVFSSIQLFDLVQDPRKSSLFKHPSFWIWSAFLLSATFSFAYRTFEPIIKFSSSRLFYYIIVSSAILKYVMVTIGLLCVFRKNSNSQFFEYEGVHTN